VRQCQVQQTTPLTLISTINTKATWRHPPMGIMVHIRLQHSNKAVDNGRFSQKSEEQGRWQAQKIGCPGSVTEPEPSINTTFGCDCSGSWTLMQGCGCGRLAPCYKSTKAKAALANSAEAGMIQKGCTAPQGWRLCAHLRASASYSTSSPPLQ